MNNGRVSGVNLKVKVCIGLEVAGAKLGQCWDVVNQQIATFSVNMADLAKAAGQMLPLGTDQGKTLTFAVAGAVIE